MGWQMEGLSHLSLPVCRDPQEEVGPLEHPSCQVLEVLLPGWGLGRGVLGKGLLTHHSLLCCPDSTNSSENMYTIMNPIGPAAGRANVSGGCWEAVTTGVGSW